MTFEEFVAARLPALVRYAAVLAGDRELAQDVVQEALVRAHVRWRRIAAMDSPDRYVKRMVTTEYLSWRRNRDRRAAALARRRVFPQPFVADHADGTAERSALWQRLMELPARQRAVLVLGYYEGLSDPEIADVLGCRSGTVRVHRARALATLRSALAAPTPAFDLAGGTA